MPLESCALIYAGNGWRPAFGGLTGYSWPPERYEVLMPLVCDPENMKDDGAHIMTRNWIGCNLEGFDYALFNLRPFQAARY